MDALPVLKALGDDTRFGIYRELTLSPTPLSASEMAERVGLHANTVRPHLERLREVGLVTVETNHRGTVGRPQHRYAPAPNAPGVGFDPPAYTLLAGLLAALAEQAGAESLDATRIGVDWGARAAARAGAGTCLERLVRELDRLGFEPGEEELGLEEVEAGNDRTWSKISFLHCPFRELAEAYPELVCNLHRGIVQGVVGDADAGAVEEFSALYDRDPCNAIISAAVS